MAHSGNENGGWNFFLVTLIHKKRDLLRNYLIFIWFVWSILIISLIQQISHGLVQDSYTNISKKNFMEMKKRLQECLDEHEGNQKWAKQICEKNVKNKFVLNSTWGRKWCKGIKQHQSHITDDEVQLPKKNSVFDPLKPVEKLPIKISGRIDSNIIPWMFSTYA